jgi:hypothetical protein
MSNIILGQNYDPLVFIVNQLTNNIKDSTNNNAIVTVSTTFPRSVNQLPYLVVQQGRELTKWISIPNYRQRWYSNFNIYVYALSPSQRFAIELSFRNYIISVTAPPIAQLAQNFVFEEVLEKSVPDIATQFGSPIYRSLLVLRLIYDVTY